MGNVAGAAANLSEQAARLCTANRWGPRPAFYQGDRALTHAQVHDGAARCAGVLAGRGVRRGDRVLIALPDGVDFILAFLGAVRVGAVAVPVNPRLTAVDHAFMLADLDPAAVVCADDLPERFSGAPAVVGAGELSSLAARADPAPAVAVHPGEVAYAQYTSGTTGPPKAALHRHGDPEVFARALGAEVLCTRPDDVLLSVSKLFFAYGFGNSLVLPLFFGASAVLHPGEARQDAVAAAAERWRPTLLFSVPSWYAGMVSGGDPGPYRRVRAAVSAGEALAPALGERAGDWLGAPVLDGLGSTEVGQHFCSNVPGAMRAGTVGRALGPYRVEVRDPGGLPLGRGEEGELWVSGPTVLVGYLNHPEATTRAVVGGWLRTGDRAEIDADGYVHHRGRDDDVEIVGGINLSPHEVEAVLGGHQRVAEVAVASVADATGASRLRAFVVTSPGPPGDAALEAELIATARARLAPYKVPRSVEFVDALPRTPTGKLRRFLLRSGHLEGARPG